MIHVLSNLGIENSIKSTADYVLKSSEFIYNKGISVQAVDHRIKKNTYYIYPLTKSIKYGKTLRLFLPGAFYTTPGPPGTTEHINLTAYSRMLIKHV